MDLVESLNPAAFTEYLKSYGNTICGRHPIGVLLQVIFFYTNLISIESELFLFLFCFNIITKKKNVKICIKMNIFLFRQYNAYKVVQMVKG